MDRVDEPQFVDSKISKIKFNREVDEFQENLVEYCRKGIICTNIDSLSIDFIFAVPPLKPSPIAFAVRFEYSNWDVLPPSLKFIDPFTKELVTRKDIGINFFQVRDKTKINIDSNGRIRELDLLQGNDNILPFFCVPGVLEYHNHPAHSGDSWMLYRTKGEGKLCVLLDQLYQHSIAQAGGYRVQVNMNPTISITGINSDVNKLRL